MADKKQRDWEDEDSDECAYPDEHAPVDLHKKATSSGSERDATNGDESHSEEEESKDGKNKKDDSANKEFRVPAEGLPMWRSARAKLVYSARARYRAESLRALIDEKVYNDWALGLAPLPQFCPSSDEFNHDLHKLVCKQADERTALLASHLDKIADTDDAEAARLLESVKELFEGNDKGYEKSKEHIDHVVAREKQRWDTASKFVKKKFATRTLETEEEIVKAVRKCLITEPVQKTTDAKSKTQVEKNKKSDGNKDKLPSARERADQRSRFANFRWNWSPMQPVGQGGRGGMSMMLGMPQGGQHYGHLVNRAGAGGYGRMHQNNSQSAAYNSNAGYRYGPDYSEGGWDYGEDRDFYDYMQFKRWQSSQRY